MAFVFFCQAEDGIRDLVRSRGLGDVYKRQPFDSAEARPVPYASPLWATAMRILSVSLSVYAKRTSGSSLVATTCTCLLYTSDAADERSSVDLGGRRIIKKKKKRKQTVHISK